MIDKNSPWTFYCLRNEPPIFENDKLVLKDKMALLDYCCQTNTDITKFNYPVKISSDVKDCSHMFHNFHSFNQPIEIPEGVSNCDFMFSNCYSFNQTINIPDSVKSCDSMFFDCFQLNSPITFSNSVYNCSQTFSGCTKFNQNLEIPKSCCISYRMLSGCEKFKAQLTYLGEIDNIKRIMKKYLYMPFQTVNSILQINSFNLWFAMLNCPNNFPIILSTKDQIVNFDSMLKYSQKNYLIEMTARLLQFKHDNLDKFPGNHFKLD